MVRSRHPGVRSQIKRHTEWKLDIGLAKLVGIIGIERDLWKIPGHSHRNIFGSGKPQVVRDNGSQGIISLPPGDPGYGDVRPVPGAHQNTTNAKLKTKKSSTIY